MERGTGTPGAPAPDVGDDRLDEDVARLERLLRHISHAVYTKGRAILGDFGITSPQFDALLWLHWDGDMSMGALCDRMSLACSTVTDLVARMEKGGFVVRERDKSDRRVINVRLLPPGENMVAKVMAARIRYLKNILKDLTVDERTMAISALEMIHNLIKEPSRA